MNQEAIVKTDTDGGSGRSTLLRILNEGVGIIILIGVVIFFSIWSGGRIFQLSNLQSILDQCVAIILGGAGVIFVISMGSINISIGAVATLSAIFGCMLGVLHGGFSTIVLMILVSTAFGLLIGFLVSKCKIPSFMCSIAMLIAIGGLNSYFLGIDMYVAPTIIRNLARHPAKYVIFFVALAILWFIFEKTRFGYYCKAMGENELCVQSAGVNTKRVRMLAFTVSGVACGVMTLFLLMRQGGMSPTYSSSMEMRAMIAVFLGGVPGTGGFGSRMYKVVVGAFTTTILINGLTICHVSSEYLQMVEGICLIGIIWLTGVLRNRTAVE